MVSIIILFYFFLLLEQNTGAEPHQVRSEIVFKSGCIIILLAKVYFIFLLNSCVLKKGRKLTTNRKINVLCRATSFGQWPS